MAYRKSLDFLPSIFQTRTNEKILQATVDQLISEPEIRRLDGYIGRRFNPALTPNDSYIAEDFVDRQNYQLEPSAVYTDDEGNIKFVSGYVDLLDKINSYGGVTNNPSRLFSADQYSYSGLFDFDKFINYSSYYWLPNGPDSVGVFATEIPTNQDIDVIQPDIYSVVDGTYDFESFDSIAFDVSENTVTKISASGYKFSTTGNDLSPVIRLARGGTYRFNVDQVGHGFFIQSQPGLDTSYNWQSNLGVRDVLGVVNNGEDVGTVTFNVPEKNAQDFFLNMPIQGKVNLVAYSTKKRRKLKYTDVQNSRYTDFINEFGGIDSQRNLIGKRILFLEDESTGRVPQPWVAQTQYYENDLVIYSNTVYRVLTDHISSRVFSTSNLEIYDLGDHWYDPALFDATSVGFDSDNFDRGDAVPLEDQLGWFQIDVNNEGIIELTPIDSIDVNNKVDIGEGTQFGNRQVYRSADNRLELISPITANQDYLYYQDGLDPNINGVIELVDQDNNLNINVENILGSKNYTSPNGIVFENGLKVKFTGETVPAEYENKEYYIEGVGTGIELVAVEDLETPEPWLDTISTPFDSERFDSESFDKSQPAPINKQYVTIKRNSQEGSAWTRQNRWFHERVINNTNSYNNFNNVIDQSNRAKRPIIEFDANLQMYNFGSKYKGSVTVIDTQETDVLSNVEGLAVESFDGAISTYYSDGIPLVNGNRVIFANDLDETIKRTIWEVQWVTVESDENNRVISFIADGSTTVFDLNFNVSNSIRLSVSIDGAPAGEAGYLYSLVGQDIIFETAPPADSVITATYTFGQQIHLESIDTVQDGDVILSTLGNTKQGTNWYFDGTAWVKSQTKIENNQAPLFDLFDNSGNSVSNQEIYFGSNFRGNKIFGYKIGNGAKDTELDLRLSYKNINNVGDIVFVDYISNDNFSYEDVDENSIIQSTKNLVAKKNLLDSSVFVNQWTKLSEKSKQYQTQTFFATQYQKNRFRLNVTPASLLPTDILVYVNNVPLLQSQFDITVEQGIGYLDLNNDLNVDDKVDVKVFSNTFTSSSVWEIPSNLENNAKNQDVKELTLGQLRNHILESFVKTPGIENAYQGSNNVKDLPDVKVNGGTILQNAGAPHLASLFLNDAKSNFVESLLYAQREYTTFKNKFVKLAEDLPLTDFNDPVKSVDEILENLFENKNELFPFYYSDMVPAGKNYTKISYTITNSNIETYYLSEIFDITQSSNRAVLVYLNGQQLTYGLDYTFTENQPVVVLNIAPENPVEDVRYLEVNDGDVLEIREYTNTDGFHVPPTPTKLGLYPASRPKVVVDGYSNNTVNVIRGHDGSFTVAYGDYRDNIILELEKRIYNNIKTRYTGELMNIVDYIPGAFRDTDYTKREFENVLSTNFGIWLGKNNLQISNYDNFDANNGFTWNYNQFTNRIDNNKMSAGYWRGLYRYYYDTEQPNLRPWEMLGFNEEPNWWVTEYGPAPYTSGNTVLWNDLETGTIRFGDRAGVDTRYARPGLSKIIPVNDSGELLSPLESIAANTSIDVSGPWSFGDVGPVEAAWRQSSEYPFAIQLALALTKPAEYFGLLRNTNDQVVTTYETEKNRQWKFLDSGVRNKVEYINGEIVNNNTIRTSGYLNWISDYVKSMNLDVTEEVGKKLRNTELRLSYKVGGYTDKKYIKLYADQSSPNSLNSSVIIPDEDYQVKLVKSSPRLSLTYSGVIITNTGNGYSVSGYDQTKPYFIIEISNNSGDTKVISVGNDTIEVSKTGTGRTALVPYNTELVNKSEVVDFLISYGRYLSRQGFRFDRKVEGTNDYYNWELAAKEFLFWSQQGWDNDVVLTVSPIGDELDYRSSRGSVDAISNKPYGSRILNNNFSIINNNQYTVNRDGRNFSLKTSDSQGIYLADLDVVDYEHVIVLNNTTRFNDVIYQPELGNRQYRIKISGFKTGDWDGTFGAAGFIINDNNIQKWQPGKNYFKGEIVIYKEKYYVASKNVAGSTVFDNSNWLETEYNQINSTLLPNLSNRAAQPKSFYDFNQANLELDADKLGKGLIGFSPRQYLDDLGISDTSQVKFYQGMIEQKGSNNSFDKLLRAKLDNFDGSTEIFEQWAIRNGSYGITDNTKQLRIPLSLSSASIKNPVVVELLDANDDKTTGRISLKEKDLLSYSRPFNKNFIQYRNSKSEVYDLPTAGFVKQDEVDYISNNFNRLPQVLDGNVTDGSRVWIGRNDSNTWNVYRFNDIDVRLDTISIDGNGVATVKVNSPHNLETNDRVYIKTYPNSKFANVYTVTSIINDKTFTVSTGFKSENQTAINGVLYSLVELKQSTVNGIINNTPINGWKNGDQVYVENATESGWGVYEKQSRFNTVNRYLSSVREVDDQLGVSVASARNSDYLLAGSSNTSTVQTFKKNARTGDLNADAVFTDVSNGLVDFGSTISASSVGYAAVGSPLSGNVGYVHVLTRSENNSFIVAQALAPSTLDAGGEYGKGLAISDNGAWLYVGQPNKDNGYVWVYQLVTVGNRTSVVFTGNGSSTVFTLTGDFANPDSIYAFKIVDNLGKVLIPFRDYNLSGSNIEFVNPPSTGEFQVFFESYYQYVTKIDLADAAGDQFGYSIATSDVGNQVIIGSPTDDSSISVTDSGKVFVVERTIENYYGTGSRTTFTTDSTVLGTPVITVDGISKSVGTDYTFNGTNTFTFNTAPDNGSIVKIESNNFVLSQTLEDFESVQTGAQFGYSLDLCPNNCSLYIGAPYEDDSTIDGGNVHRFINQGRFFGTVTGTVVSPIISVASKIAINNFIVSFNETDGLDTVIEKINSARIPGVTASNVNNKLKIDSDREIFADKLNLVLLSGNFFADTGIDLYASQQVISSPRDKNYNNFGKVVKVNRDALYLAVGTDQGDARLQTTFDNNTTSFDNNSTLIKSNVKQSGSVFLYQLITKPNSTVDDPSQLILAEELVPNDIDEFDNFGAAIDFSNNTVYVGAPGNDYNGVSSTGLIYGFTNNSESKTWDLIRSETPKTDLGLINRVYLYNKVSGEKIVDFDIIDPAKGFISGAAKQEISYQTEVDPASYSRVNNATKGIVWGKEHVGEIWWDISLTQWADYEQDDIEYRAANWGFAFPGSRVICAEWTESTQTPENYSDPSNPNSYPLNPNNFNIFTEYNQKTGRFDTKYYFWVAGKTRAPRGVPNRRLSAAQIEEIIANPKLNNVPYIAFYNSNSFGIYNVSRYVQDNAVLVVDYDVELNDSVLHSEYNILSEGDRNSIPEHKLVTKMIDSLAGQDRSGNLVPDINLNDFEKLGIGFRPRQTMFVDRKRALKETVSYINRYLLTVPTVYSKNLARVVATEPFPDITEYSEVVENRVELDYLITELLSDGYLVLVKSDETTRNRWVIYKLQNGTWVKNRVQNYNNSRYIDYVNWTDSGVDVPGIIETVVDFEYNLQSITASEGDFVKIRDNGLGLFKVVLRENNTWRTVQEEKGTIQISESIWKTENNRQGWDNDGFGLQLFDDWPSAETQNIIRSIYEDVFVEEDAVQKNLWFLHMIKYTFTENQYNDWAFKTSLIKVNQTQRALQQIPVYQKDNQDLIRQYIEEVKPYHTKISEFVLQYNGTDVTDAKTTDFDLPAYYNFATGTYRSPTGQTVEDDIVLQLDPYLDWTNNYTLELTSVDIYHGGSGYVTPPTLTVTGGGGSGAVLEAVVSNGRITNVVVVDGGSGYITTPTIVIGTSTSDPAILSPRLVNNKVRSFDTTIKFDRVSTPAGWLVEFKNGSGESVDVRNESISRVDGNGGVIDAVLELLSNGAWIVASEDLVSYPVAGVPNYRFFNDTSGRVQFYERRDTRGWNPELLQTAIRNLGASVGINNIDISGTTVTLDGSLASFMSSVLPWQEGFTYYQGEYIGYNNKLYVVDQQFTASSNFSSENLVESTGAELISHLDRTWALYQPTDGMLGKDLSQLFDGVVFPGVNVLGASFSLNPGFDVNNFDTTGFDSSVIGPEGVAVIDPAILDQTLYSTFLDTTLGTKPEDIITQGGSFVDTYHSHAPEEMIPGRVYDTLDLKVHTLASNALLQNTTFGLDWDIISHETDGVTTRFSFDADDIHIGDHLLVYLKDGGPRYRDITESGQSVATSIPVGSFYETNQSRSYTVDYTTNEIVFTAPPAADDVLQIYNFRLQGESIIADEVFESDGSTTSYVVNQPYDDIENSMLLINGVETQDYTLSADTSDSGNTIITLVTAPNENDHLHFVASSNSAQDSISKPYTQLELVDNANRTVDLDESIRYDRSKDTVMIVELNGTRLRPGNTNYYTGDGSTAVYNLPTSAGETYATLASSEVNVWINSELVDTLDYVLSAVDKTVTFLVSPSDGDNISITYTADSEYVYNSVDNSITIDGSVTVPDGSLLAVTSFSSHDVYNIKTKVFVGGVPITTTTIPGYDNDGFDESSYDASVTITGFEIERNATDIIVSVDGIKMVPNDDYVVENRSVIFADSVTIGSGTVIVITWTSAIEYESASTYRIFKDMNDNVTYNRLTVDESTELVQNLTLTDTEILVKDASKLANPNPELGIPGVVFINAERITYYTKVGNTLGQIRRGTNGTGAASVHPAGSMVIDSSLNTTIPNGGDGVWYTAGSSTPSNGLGLNSAKTIQARFITERKGLSI